MTDQADIRPITLDDIIATEGLDEYKGMEIVDGVWVAKHRDEDMSITHGRLGVQIIGNLWNYEKATGNGQAYMSETIFILHVDEHGVRTTRKPDASFVLKQNVKPPETGYYHQAPDLAVEIISPSERIGIIQDKLDDYFTYGTQQVWLVYPDKKRIVVHFPDESSQTYKMGDTLTGGDLLPGFTLEIAAVFGESHT